MARKFKAPAPQTLQPLIQEQYDSDQVTAVVEEVNAFLVRKMGSRGRAFFVTCVLAQTYASMGEQEGLGVAGEVLAQQLNEARRFRGAFHKKH